MLSILGIVFALSASLMYGGGDFAGGAGARRLNPFQVLLLAAATGILPLFSLGLLWGEVTPSSATVIWAALAGIFGSLGLATLYRGLSTSSAAIVSPTAAVVGATVPLIYGSFVEGLPSVPRMAGFLLALIGIWLVARPHPASLPNHGRGLMLGIAAGIAFGAYFILIAQVQRGSVFFPLTVAKLTSIPFVLGILAARRLRVPSPLQAPVTLLAGIMDAAGNAFFLLARQYTRLDVAAVIASLYPAVTVILARLIYKEVISRSQWAGLMLCLVAIGLIVY
jgi:drug/metabolite transporter (DMT)-like permease